MGTLAGLLFEEFGLPVLQECVGQSAAAYLTPRGGPRAGPFDVIVENVTTQREDGDGRTLEHVLIARFPIQDGLPFWSGANLVGLAVEIRGEAWACKLVENLSDSLATVRLTRRATSEVARPGYRRQ